MRLHNYLNESKQIKKLVVLFYSRDDEKTVKKKMMSNMEEFEKIVFMRDKESYSTIFNVHKFYIQQQKSNLGTDAILYSITFQIICDNNGKRLLHDFAEYIIETKNTYIDKYIDKLNVTGAKDRVFINPKLKWIGNLIDTKVK